MSEEHFETIQSLAPDERSRARRLALTMLPAIVLIAVIGAAVFGGRTVRRRPLQPAATIRAPGRTGGRGQRRPGCRGAPGRRLSGARWVCRFTRSPGRWPFVPAARSRTRSSPSPAGCRSRPSPTVAGRSGGHRRAVRHRRRLPSSNRAHRRCRARVRRPGRRGHPGLDAGAEASCARRRCPACRSPRSRSASSRRTS